MTRYQTVSRPIEWEFNRKTVYEEGEDKAETDMENFYLAQNDQIEFTRYESEEYDRESLTPEIRSERRDRDGSDDTIMESATLTPRQHYRELST